MLGKTNPFALNPPFGWFTHRKSGCFVPNTTFFLRLLLTDRLSHNHVALLSKMSSLKMTCSPCGLLDPHTILPTRSPGQSFLPQGQRRRHYQVPSQDSGLHPQSGLRGWVLGAPAPEPPRVRHPSHVPSLPFHPAWASQLFTAGPAERAEVHTLPCHPWSLPPPGWNHTFPSPR